jgi:hypothetical protein
VWPPRIKLRSGLSTVAPVLIFYLKNLSKGKVKVSKLLIFDKDIPAHFFNPLPELYRQILNPVIVALVALVDYRLTTVNR